MIVPAILLIAALAVLTAAGERRDADTDRIFRLNLSVGLCGVGLLLVSAALGTVAALTQIRTDASREWALSVTSGFGFLVGSVFAVVALALLLSSLSRRKGTRGAKYLRFIRIAVGLAGSAACLLLSALWARMSAGGTPDLSLPFFAAGTGCALALRLPLLPEYRRRNDPRR